MSYINEFGPGFDLGFDLIDYPYLNDKSWRNDVSPSFYFIVDSQYYVLWVDYAEQAERESYNNRYIIQKAANEGSKENPEIYSSDGEVVFESEFFEGFQNFFRKISS